MTVTASTTTTANQNSDTTSSDEGSSNAHGTVDNDLILTPSQQQQHNYNKALQQLHHDRLKHHTRTETEYNIFRDSYLRYLGYANEVGESFRYQFPKFVLPSYIVSFGYCCADAISSGKQAYDDEIVISNNNNNNNNNSSTNNIPSAVATATIDTLVWQSLASVMIPGATINAIVKMSRWTITKVNQRSMNVPSMAMTWLPTCIGLGSIPLIIHPIDESVDYFMEHTFRKYIFISQQSDKNNKSE